MNKKTVRDLPDEMLRGRRAPEWRHDYTERPMA